MNLSMLLEFAACVCLTSTALKTLIVTSTQTTADEAKVFLDSLQEVTTLETLDLSHNKEWFGEANQANVELLVATLRNQPKIKKLSFKYCKMTASQTKEIRAAVKGKKCKIEIKD